MHWIRTTSRKRSYLNLILDKFKQIKHFGNSGSQLIKCFLTGVVFTQQQIEQIEPIEHSKICLASNTKEIIWKWGNMLDLSTK